MSFANSPKRTFKPLTSFQLPNCKLAHIRHSICPLHSSRHCYEIDCGTHRVPGAFPQTRAAPMKLLPRKKISRSFFGGVTGLLIVLGSSAVIAQTQPATPASTTAAPDTDGSRRICHPGESFDGYESAEAKVCARHYRRRRAAEHQTGATASRDCPKSAEGASVLRQGRRNGGPRQSQRSSRGGRHKKETERLNPRPVIALQHWHGASDVGAFRMRTHRFHPDDVADDRDLDRCG